MAPGKSWISGVAVPAGVAQLVERNLAKVEVESSRLFSRSRIRKRLEGTGEREAQAGFPFYLYVRSRPEAPFRGAGWSTRGQRIRAGVATIRDGMPLIFIGKRSTGRGGRVVMQRPAKPSIWVRFPSPPPVYRQFLISDTSVRRFSGSCRSSWNPQASNGGPAQQAPKSIGLADG